VKIRLHGLPEECDRALERLAKVFDVVSVSDRYFDRPPSRLVRVYVEIRL